MGNLFMQCSKCLLLSILYNFSPFHLCTCCLSHMLYFTFKKSLFTFKLPISVQWKKIGQYNNMMLCFGSAFQWRQVTWGQIISDGRHLFRINVIHIYTILDLDPGAKACHLFRFQCLQYSRKKSVHDLVNNLDSKIGQTKFAKAPNQLSWYTRMLANTLKT